ncbi:MAG: TIGR02186 family protein [Hyphomicrobiaceae bacterium]|nr:TIGR02186 family protein [Hyphomicrobiaceae bacterium]
MQPPQQAIPATPQQRAPQQAAPQQLAPQQAAPVPQAQPAQRSGRPSPPALDRKESVEADVSTRSVAVTSSFTGTEIVIFGSVDNSRQQTAESGLYDIAIIVEGTETPVVARKKSNIAGLWINTQSANFSGVPSYYTITSTRPIEEIAETQVLSDNAIGFEHVGMTPSPETKLSAAELDEFKKAVVRRKQADNLYQKRDYGVVFIGRSLFRSTITLPANVPVGPLSARTFLFKDGKLLSSHTSKVSLQREGIERLLHSFAFDYPLLYGIFAVLTAVAAGLIASALFRRGSH